MPRSPERRMASGGVGSPAITLLVLVAFVCSGCLGGPSSERGDGPSATPDDDAGPVEVFSPGWPDLGGAVVRPGVKIAGANGAVDCTANFVFSTPDNQTLYLGAASHCFIGAAIGDPMSIASGAVTGTLVYCSWGTIDGSDTCSQKTQIREGWANDFALIELPDDSRNLVHPALLHWGGPTGILGSPPGPDVHVLTFGNSALRDADQEGLGSDAADAREGITVSPINPSAYSAEWTTFVRFAPPATQGDDGSPVILANGTAFGILAQFTLAEGADRVTQLSPALAYLHNNTELQVELKTHQMLADPILPWSGVIATKAQDANGVHAA